MPRHATAVFIGAVLGCALGAAVATGAPADASPVDNAWPYGDFQLPGAGTSPGVTADGLGFVHGVVDYSVPGYGDAYSTTYDGIQIAFFGYDIQQKVFDSVGPLGSDASAYVPPDGTTIDTLSLPFLTNTLIVDPDVGIGDQFQLPFLTNTFISDNAGTQDVLSVSGQDFTLFDIPASPGIDGLIDGS